MVLWEKLLFAQVAVSVAVLMPQLIDLFWFIRR